MHTLLLLFQKMFSLVAGNYKFKCDSCAYSMNSQESKGRMKNRENLLISPLLEFETPE